MTFVVREYYLATVGLEQRKCLLIYTAYFLSGFTGEAINEVLNQQGNVFSALAQRRHFYRKHIEAIEEIAAKCTGCHRCLQITVRCHNHPGVYLNGPISSHPAQTRVPGAHAGERSGSRQESSPISSKKIVPPSANSKRPRRPLSCAGERTLLVPEQLRRDQRWWG